MQARTLSVSINIDSTEYNRAIFDNSTDKYIKKLINSLVEQMIRERLIDIKTITYQDFPNEVNLTTSVKVIIPN